MNEYTVSIGGIAHTVLLSDEQARERGITPYSERKLADNPAEKLAEPKPNKARKPRNK